MCVRSTCLASLILFNGLVSTFGEAGEAASTPKARSTGPTRSVAESHEPDELPPQRPSERTVQDVQKSHPREIQAQLDVIAENLTAAGLTDEVNRLRDLQRRVGSEHFDRLVTAQKRAQAKVPQIKLHVQWVEYINSSAITPLRQLMEPAQPVDSSSNGPPATKPNGAGKPTARVTAFIDELVKRKLGTVVADPPITLLSGETTEFERGQEMDLNITDEGSNMILTFTKSDSPTETNNGKNTRWVGTFVKTSVAVAKDNRIHFSLAIDHADAALSPIPRRIEEEVEISEGQSLIVAGVPTFQSVTETHRLPMSDDVDVTNTKRFFPFKVGRQDKRQELSVVTPGAASTKTVLVVITPEVVRPLESDKAVSIPETQATRQRPATIKTTAAPAGKGPQQRR